MGASTGEILLVLARLFISGFILAGLYLAWRGGALRLPKNAPRGRRAAIKRWAWIPVAVAAVWVAVAGVKGQLEETDDQRATLLAFVIVVVGVAALGFFGGAVLAVVQRLRKR